MSVLRRFAVKNKAKQSKTKTSKAYKGTKIRQNIQKKTRSLKETNSKSPKRSQAKVPNGGNFIDKTF